MRTVVRVILGFATFGSLIALVLSAWPGILHDLLFITIIFSVIWVPVAIIVSIVAAIALLRRHRQERLSRASLVEVAAIPGVAILALALLIFYVPRRVTFLACRSSFEAAVSNTPESTHGVPFGERLGIYRVDRRATDPRGGTFFRVYDGPDGLGPDTMSYGFVKRPNVKGTPFGSSHYAIFHLVDDWYWFHASDDWY